MTARKSSDETLIAAMRMLARDIQCDDGVANAAILEAADRLEELVAVLVEIRDSKYCNYENSGSGQYGIGIADGHRFCADMARRTVGQKG